MKNNILDCETIEEVEELLEHENWMVRLDGYDALGFTEEAFEDKDEDIRLEAYCTLGFTKKALEENSWKIRLEAYRRLGFTEEALEDKSFHIRKLAKNYFHVQKLKQKHPPYYAVANMKTNVIYKGPFSSYEEAKKCIKQNNYLDPCVIKFNNLEVINEN